MNRDYTVGWVCALPTEMSAAKAMLDEYHGMPQYQHKSDNNSYYLGRISGHNVALASLPAGVYGTTSAAVVATQMQSSFESIRFGLMVGIGGGIPSERFDIRLGDVVVSKPENSYGGVVQYDMGKSSRKWRVQTYWLAEQTTPGPPHCSCQPDGGARDGRQQNFPVCWKCFG